jgi:hypothetical protein
MAQASARALLRRLGRHPAALLRRRLLSSVPAPSSSQVAPHGPSHLGGHGGSRGLSTWVGSHPRPRLPRRHHAAAPQVASRYPYSSASLALFSSPEMLALAVVCLTKQPFLYRSSESPAATASSDASTVASHSEAVRFIKSTFGKLEGM